MFGVVNAFKAVVAHVSANSLVPIEAFPWVGTIITIELSELTAAPAADTAPFDLIVNKGERFLRLQVKATLEKHTYSQSRPHYQFQLAHGPSAKTRYTADQVDFFVCCALDSRRFWVLPFEAATVITLKIYNGKDGKLHRYEDAWVLLEK